RRPGNFNQVRHNIIRVATGIRRRGAQVRAKSRKESLMLLTLAQATTSLIGDRGLAILGIGLGAGLTVLGAAKGIGHLAGQAMEGIARQPEAGGRIGTNMIIAAALIEGFTFFALVITFQLAGKIPSL